MTTSDPATPDAVTMLRRMHARAVERENRGDVPHIGSDEVLAVLRTIEAEVSALQSRLKRVEKERDEALEESKGWQRAAVSLERRLLVDHALGQRESLNELPVLRGPLALPEWHRGGS